MSLADKLSEHRHIFELEYMRYLHKGYSVIPDKYGKKMPAIKGWSDYCYKLPTKDECKSWVRNLDESNIAICLGPASGIVALDLDCVDPQILEIIMPMLPESPSAKVGAKGETRFFRYCGDTTDILKFNGEVVVEILSAGKKTTIPPSLHVNGSTYTWKGEELLKVDKEKLPMLPPALFSHIQSVLKSQLKETVTTSFNKVSNGRNDSLSSLCGSLIAEGKGMDEVVRNLIEFDEKEHEIPLFTDPEENRHTEAYTNALLFYVNHLTSINTRRYRESKEYELPVMQTVADIAKVQEIKAGKLVGQGKLKRRSVESLPVHGAIKNIYSTILKNSWIKQPDLAFGATLTLLSTLASRKIVFQGMSPNLYVLNVAPSGSGKDAPQQTVKNILMEIGAESLLGAGDYVSDASLMDSLSTNPVRLDIMDEAGGILRTVNTGKAEYNGKMADVLAELYTTSNNKYLGRATAEGRKGSCYRPNVNILASTTPTGFMEGVSIKAIEKGLMGRFLIFTGDQDQKAERLTTFPKIPVETKQLLQHWFSFRPQDYVDVQGQEIAGIPQNYVELEAENEANEALDKIFNEFDKLRRETDPFSPLLPIIARLYQQMVKLVIISAVARTPADVPKINKKDVDFGHATILYYYEGIKEVVNKYIFGNKQEQDTLSVLNLIKDNGNRITKTALSRATRKFNKRQREAIIEDLIESEQLVRTIEQEGTRNVTVYYVMEDECSKE